ncbi:MAG: glycosyltransferase family 39 protein [Candidatus Woesebacteria bacterium]|jgi:hypothetical protein
MKKNLQKFLKNFSQNKYLFYLILIIILGSFLRFYNLNKKMRFIWDEGRDMLAIRRMIVEKNLTLFGPFNEIDGRIDFFGVFHYYLMAPALYLSAFDPIGPTAFTAFLGVISIILVYLLIKTWTKRENLALTTSLIYAVNPLVIKYVQWSWNPNTTPFFALLYFLALSKLKESQKINWSALAGLFLGLMFQLHYFTLAAGVAWLIVIVYSLSSSTHSSKSRAQVQKIKLAKFQLAKQLFRKIKRLNKIFYLEFLKHFALFISFFILPNLSFIIFDLSHEYFYWNIINRSFSSGSQQIVFFSLKNLLFNPIKFSQLLMQGLFSLSAHFALGLALFFILYLAKIIYQAVKNKKLSLSFLIAITFFNFLIQISFFPKTYDDYHLAWLYFGILYLIIDLIFKLLAKNKKIFYLFIFFLTTYMLANIKIFRQSLWSENMPLIREIAYSIAADVKKNNLNQRFNIAAFTDSNTRGIRYRYFLDVAELKPLDIYHYPEAEVLYVITPHDEKITQTNNVWELDTFKNARIKKVSEFENIKIFKLEK